MRLSEQTHARLAQSASSPERGDMGKGEKTEGCIISRRPRNLLPSGRLSRRKQEGCKSTISTCHLLTQAVPWNVTLSA